SPDARARWLARNRQTRDEIAALVRGGGLSKEESLDLELLARHVDREIFALDTLERPRLDPLYWTGILGNATVFLLVRDHGTPPPPRTSPQGRGPRRELPRPWAPGPRRPCRWGPPTPPPGGAPASPFLSRARPPSFIAAVSQACIRATRVRRPVTCRVRRP